ncbi:MAG: hypothetical protein OEY09_17830 [Gammaproteobacteria bacterium]|nr:hypothetical protein [Gammaproteobacteria bacterium]
MIIKNLFFPLMVASLVSGCVFPDNYHYSPSSGHRSMPSETSSSSSLPYGLQKKLQRGQSLPPGWQKKLYVGNVLDMRIYRQSEIVVPVDRHGLVTLRVEGKLIRLYQATREITEILN